MRRKHKSSKDTPIGGGWTSPWGRAEIIRKERGAYEARMAKRKNRDNTRRQLKEVANGLVALLNGLTAEQNLRIAYDESSLMDTCKKILEG